jgi:transcriptional regulator with XRE-family HTH domain
MLKGMNALQENLKRQLEEKKMSAHALEKRAGLRPSAVQNILQGKSKRPAAELLQAIANELDCTVEDLLIEGLSVQPERTPASHWNLNLYIDALKTVQAIINAKKTPLDKNQTLKIVDEVYLYSVKARQKTADKTFADWLLSQNR